MNQSHELENYIYNNVLSQIENINLEIAKDIYSLSFYVTDEEDDPRFITCVLGFNTFENFNKNIETASSELEAKWNYAFWLQNNLFDLGDNGSEKGIELRASWIENLGFMYTDEEENADFERCLLLGENIISSFVDLLVRVTRKIHESGIIEAKFTRKVPIIIHELEYYEQIAIQNEEANPGNCVDEFTSWIRSE